MIEWEWNGARWWKCDFHTHTPASDDYGKGKNQKELKKITPEEWLMNYMLAGIDCVAITDHNTGDWIDKVKDALIKIELKKPEGYRPLFVFPGIEISVSGGVHILAIFGSEREKADIDSLLGAVGFPLASKGLCNAVTTKSLIEVIEAITSAGGIAIPAHVDENNGLFCLTGTTLQQALDCKNIFTIELMNKNYQKPQSFIDKNLFWTEILNSDGHHPTGDEGQRYPGSHFSWIKMGSPCIEGFRLALLDGSLSTGRSDQVTGDPNKHAPLVLESIDISQARYLGRAQPFKNLFNPWLNTLIGGRGTGKSTIIEFLRIALRRQDELPEDLLPEFEKYGRIYPNREDGGLLTDETALKVIYRKNGSRFRVQWSPSGNLEPIEKESDGKWLRAEGDIRQRFPIRIYSQKQIFQLAKTPLSLLRVIDEAPEVNYRSWLEKWKNEEARFLSLRAKARELETGLAEEPRLKGELDDVKRKLAVFEQAGHAEILKAFQKRSRQQRDIEAWEESWISTGDRLRELANNIVPDLLDETSFDSQSTEDKQLSAHATVVHDSLQKICKSIEELASRADEIVSEWRKNKNESLWSQRVRTASQAYHELRDKLSKEKVGDPAAYGELVQRRQAIEQRLKEFVDRKKQVDQLTIQANTVLKKLLEIRWELTESRRNFLDNVLKDNSYVSIQVIPYGARETVKVEFRKLLQREDESFGKDIGSPDGEGLLGEIYMNYNNAEDIERNLAGIKEKIRKIALDKYDVADRRFTSHISKLPPEAVDRLDLWFPEDSLDVQYSTTSNGQHFRSIQEGSPGQKTAALLAFLLSYGDEPLILDQPEDDLDNLLIYDLIVTQLREVKRNRQVIIVTHNPNIVVNGDAELVVALAARGGETKKECDGSLQDKLVRDTICNVMEGGIAAFEDRYRRIALEGQHV